MMALLQSIFLHLQFFAASFRGNNRMHKTPVTTTTLRSGAFLFLITVLISCGNSDKEVNDYNSKKLGVEEIKNADINYTLGGKAKAKLLSPLMLRVQDASPYVEFPQTLHVDFFNDSGKLESKLDARYGKYFESESKVFLKDSVRVINILGDTLYCNELWWDRSRKGREFYTGKPVRIRKKMEVINGTGMEAAQDFKNWLIVNPSQGLMKIPASQFPEN
jgi:LPS export ABC transporter protein LptC